MRPITRRAAVPLTVSLALALALAASGCQPPHHYPIATPAEAISLARNTVRFLPEAAAPPEVLRAGKVWLVCFELPSHAMALVTVDAETGRISQLRFSNIVMKPGTVGTLCSHFLGKTGT